MIPNKQPFFSTDVSGIIHVIEFLGGLAIIIGGFIWKIMTAPFNRRLDEYMTANETRFTSIEEEQDITIGRRSEIDNRLNTVERDQLLLSNNLRGLASIASFEKTLESFTTSQRKRDDGVVRELRRLGEKVAGLEATVRNK